MHSLRDTHLQLGVRQQTWLRREHWKRVCFSLTIFRRMLLGSLQADGGVTRLQQSELRAKVSRLPRCGSYIQQNTRCRVSGRARQVARCTGVARMHMRQLSAQGRLLGFYLSRT